MTRREAWLTAGVLFALALAVRAVAASAISFPVPEDTAYYAGVARNVVEGRGLVSDALWSYQTLPLVFPRPAFEVWLPLPALLAALPMAVFGPTFGAGQVGAVLIGSLVPVLAWRLAADVAQEARLPAGRARVLAVGTGVAACVYGPLVTHGILTDSTMPFAALALAACILMTRILREPRGPRQPSEPRGPALDWRLVGLGILLGLAALTRNEAIWLALTWAGLAWFDPSGLSRAARFRLIAVPAVVAVAIFTPWALRDWVVFGSPLPGQAAANALSITGYDIFAWQDPPTLARYLAQGFPAILGAHVEGFLHNLVTVLIVPAIPVGPIGLAALPWTVRGRALRPLVVLSVLTFVAATLLFPVATQWGTFLHSAGPIQVLLLISCMRALDMGLAWLAGRLAWTRPVAWLAPVLVVTVALPLMIVSVRSLAGVADETRQRYADLAVRLDATDPGLRSSPVIADAPIWVAEAWRRPALGLPDEEPASVVDLARAFGARLLITSVPDHGRWPAILDAGGPSTGCFERIDLRDPATGRVPSSLEATRAYRIVCS